MPTERIAYSIPETAALLGLSPNAAYEAAKRGEIPTIRFGRRIIVPAPALHRLLENGVARPPHDDSLSSR